MWAAALNWVLSRAVLLLLLLILPSTDNHYLYYRSSTTPIPLHAAYTYCEKASQILNGREIGGRRKEEG